MNYNGRGMVEYKILKTIEDLGSTSVGGRVVQLLALRPHSFYCKEWIIYDRRTILRLNHKYIKGLGSLLIKRPGDATNIGKQTIPFSLGFWPLILFTPAPSSKTVISVA